MISFLMNYKSLLDTNLAISSRPNVIEAVALHVTRAGQNQAALMLADGRWEMAVWPRQWKLKIVKPCSTVCKNRPTVGK
eukprot:s603_g10.t1